MADATSFPGDRLVITTSRDFEVTPSYVRGSTVASSYQRRQSRTLDANRNPSRTSPPDHQKFSVVGSKHPLSAIMHAPLFRGLSLSEFEEVAGVGQERIFSHNQTLFSEGAPLRSVSIVTSGHGKTIRHGAAGKPLILDILGPGDLLDGWGCSPESRHSVEARAVRHCRVFSWDVGRYEALTRRFPTLGRNSIRLLLGRLRLLEGRVHELATDRVPQRLAKTLLRLILQARGSARDSWIDLNGEDLALMAGTTQSTVSRLLCDWAEQRVIQPDHTAILVENLPGLIAIALEVDCAE